MTERVVPVNRHALKALTRAGIVPPDAGMFDPAALDAQLAAGGFDTETRMTLKGHLRDAGLLAAGRTIDDRRP